METKNIIIAAFNIARQDNLRMMVELYHNDSLTLSPADFQKEAMTRMIGEEGQALFLAKMEANDYNMAYGIEEGCMLEVLDAVCEKMKSEFYSKAWGQKVQDRARAISRSTFAGDLRTIADVKAAYEY